MRAVTSAMVTRPSPFTSVAMEAEISSPLRSKSMRAVRPIYIPGGVLPQFVGTGFYGGDVKK